MPDINWSLYLNYLNLAKAFGVICLTVIIEEIVRRFIFKKGTSAPIPVIDSKNERSAVGNINNVLITVDGRNVKNETGYVKMPSDLSQKVDIQYLKEKTNILVIDDKDFKQIDQLRTLGWKNIRKIDDLNNVDGEESNWANVILIDVQGVGGSYSKKNGGIHLTRALRDRYGDSKWLVLYSADRSYGMDVFSEAGAHDYIPKNTKPLEI